MFKFLFGEQTDSLMLVLYLVVAGLSSSFRGLKIFINKNYYGSFEIGSK
jgi:hypothetical protein